MSLDSQWRVIVKSLLLSSITDDFCSAIMEYISIDDAQTQLLNKEQSA